VVGKFHHSNFITLLSQLRGFPRNRHMCFLDL
jgi:hypothetical protein